LDTLELNAFIIQVSREHLDLSVSSIHLLDTKIAGKSGCTGKTFD
jgi:hypothetical protein